MSASMVVRRAAVQPPGVSVDHWVHGAIAPRLFGHDGSIAGLVVVHKGGTDQAYLEGLRDAHSEGSLVRRSLDVILDIIDKYDAVEIEIVR